VIDLPARRTGRLSLRWVWVVLLLVGRPTGAFAHQPAGSVSEAASIWNPDLLLTVVLAAVVITYLKGNTRLSGSAGSGRLGRSRKLLMFGGVALVALALMSPLDALGSVLFSAHMTQHLILTVAAPLLLVASRPGLALMVGAAGPLRRAASRLSYALRPATGGPAAAGLVVLGYTVVLWVWHVPALYEAALAVPMVHALEHATLFGGALLAWTVALNPNRPGTGLAALVFTALQGVALGALLTFAPRVLYPWYRTPAWGLSALEHQQLGGLLMWMPTGVVYAACCLWVLAGPARMFGGEQPAFAGPAEDPKVQTGTAVR
jgi:putative membrane protein